MCNHGVDTITATTTRITRRCTNITMCNHGMDTMTAFTTTMVIR